MEFWLYSNLLFSLSLFISVGNNFKVVCGVFFEVLGDGKGLRAGYILLTTVYSVCYCVVLVHSVPRPLLGRVGTE